MSSILDSILFRDGSGQQDRMLSALKPEYIQVDERSTVDLLRFARDYAAELKYFNAENKHDGDWSAFLEGDLDEMIQYLEEPERFEGKLDYSRRPHLALFLTFIKLLEFPRERLNTLTKRHLDFYFQEVLRMTKKAAVPDQVFLLFELAPRTQEWLLPAGTTLNAGKDSEGNDLVYTTDHDRVFNQAKIAQIKNLHQSPDGILYAASDATALTINEENRWKTFGGAIDDFPMTQQAKIGLALASPLLELSEGLRTIVLYLTFSEAVSTDYKTWLENEPFRFFLTTEEGQVEVNAAYIDDSDPLYKVSDPLVDVAYKIVLDENHPPIVPLGKDATRAEEPFSEFPVLSLLLKYAAGIGNNNDLASKLNLGNLRIEVMVDGLKDVQMQNDERILDAKKPFEPFGAFPQTGNSWYFAHPEICGKKLDTLSMDLEWMGMPDDLVAYYSVITTDGSTLNDSTLGYKIGSSDHFTSHLKIKDQNRIESLDPDWDIFSFKEDNEDPAIHYFELLDQSNSELANYPAQPNLNDPNAVLDWQRYFIVELGDPDFQHSHYQKALQNLDAGQTINAPHTPKLKKLALSYTASLEIDLSDENWTEENEALFHLHPFGYQKLEATSPFFFPSYLKEGELYIGIRDLHPPQQLSLLFQLAEGSADPDLELALVKWDFLSPEGWMGLEDGALLSDTTNGLIQSGIVLFDLSSIVVDSNPQMPENLFWIRASVENNGGSIPDTTALHTQVMKATFQNQGNAVDHLQKPLPAESITSLLEPDPAIRKVLQPYPSSSGQAQEGDRFFYTRISERLRHKNRAANIWDYERLVLEQFPEIYKVKCLPAQSEEELGVVTLIVIPDIRGKHPYNPFEPKAPASQLAAIQGFLRTQASPFAVIKVKNPNYEVVRLKFDVHFKEGYPAGYYVQVLQLALKKYLSPWAYEEGADIVLGGTIYGNALVYFIEEQPYVEYIGNMELFLESDGDQISESSNELKASAPDVIWVTATEHFITVIQTEEYTPKEGIGDMQVEYDFFVEPKI